MGFGYFLYFVLKEQSTISKDYIYKEPLFLFINFYNLSSFLFVSMDKARYIKIKAYLNIYVSCIYLSHDFTIQCFIILTIHSLFNFYSWHTSNVYPGNYIK